MSNKDYSFFYRRDLSIDSSFRDLHWDVLISAYNSSERVNIVFEKINARWKIWAIHNEYMYSPFEHPAGEVFISTDQRESDYIRGLMARVEDISGKSICDLNICIDLTGFMRPHLLFLTMYLERIGSRKFDAIYTEPMRYSKKEKTSFSKGTISSVRHIAGYEGINSPDDTRDLLIIGSGYDHRLISAVAESRDKADKIQIFGLPSLRADMYQENVLNAYKASNAIGTNEFGSTESYFAPANDPFATASTLSEIVARKKRAGPITNLYLSPLATKPQALGFGLYYIGECIGECAGIVFPVSSSYERETSTGVSRVWMYTIEFPLF